MHQQIAFGSVGRGDPKPLATEYGSLMGFQWVGLFATHADGLDDVFFRDDMGILRRL